MRERGKVRVCVSPAWPADLSHLLQQHPATLFGPPSPLARFPPPPAAAGTAGALAQSRCSLRGCQHSRSRRGSRKAGASDGRLEVREQGPLPVSLPETQADSSRPAILSRVGRILLCVPAGDRQDGGWIVRRALPPPAAATPVAQNNSAAKQEHCSKDTSWTKANKSCSQLHIKNRQVFAKLLNLQYLSSLRFPGKGIPQFG